MKNGCETASLLCRSRCLFFTFMVSTGSPRVLVFPRNSPISALYQARGSEMMSASTNNSDVSRAGVTLSNEKNPCIGSWSECNLGGSQF